MELVSIWQKSNKIIKENFPEVATVFGKAGILGSGDENKLLYQDLFLAFQLY